MAARQVVPRVDRRHRACPDADGAVEPARATQMFEILDQMFANGEPDPETAGPLLAQLDMEILAPATG
jgi:hypothetical protein